MRAVSQRLCAACVVLVVGLVPSVSFAVDGQDISKNGALVGAGVLFFREHVTASVEYLGEFRSDYMANGVFARIGFPF